MADKNTINDVKTAVREILDETSVTYVQGAGAFMDSVTGSLSGAADAFDDFFTANLERDRPHVAVTFLEMRLRSAKLASRVITKKISDLKARLAKAKRSARKK